MTSSLIVVARKWHSFVVPFLGLFATALVGGCRANDLDAPLGHVHSRLRELSGLVETLHASGRHVEKIGSLDELVKTGLGLSATSPKGVGPDLSKDQRGNQYDWNVVAAEDETIVYISYCGPPIGTTAGSLRMPFARLRLLRDGLSKVDLYEVNP